MDLLLLVLTILYALLVLVYLVKFSIAFRGGHTPPPLYACAAMLYLGVAIVYGIKAAKEKKVVKGGGVRFKL